MEYKPFGRTPVSSPLCKVQCRFRCRSGSSSACCPSGLWQRPGSRLFPLAERCPFSFHPVGYSVEKDRCAPNCLQSAFGLFQYRHASQRNRPSPPPAGENRIAVRFFLHKRSLYAETGPGQTHCGPALFLGLAKKHLLERDSRQPNVFRPYITTSHHCSSSCSLSSSRRRARNSLIQCSAASSVGYSSSSVRSSKF